MTRTRAPAAPLVIDGQGGLLCPAGVTSVLLVPAARAYAQDTTIQIMMVIRTSGRYAN